MPSGSPGLGEVDATPDSRMNGTGDDLDNDSENDPAQMKQEQQRLKLALKNIFIATSVMAVVLVAYWSD